jgi:cystathionine gamma-lyase
VDWSKDRFGFETRAIHAGQAPDPATGAIMTPIHMTSTYVQSAPGVHKGYDYSRSSNPTRTAYETCVANLEGARFGFATGSGCAAITTIGHLLSEGDHIVAGDDMYGGTYRLFEHVFTRSGIEFTYADLSDPDALGEALEPNTKLVWTETPSNPLMKLMDIRALAQVAHQVDALLAVDNTFMSPYFQRPLELGADIVMHSTTKYINGHSDLVGGLVVTDDEELASRLAFLSNALGTSQGAFDAWLCMRSLKTLAVRMRAHEANALCIAEFLNDHPNVEGVLYPGLIGHPQHELAKEQMTGFGGMLSFYVKGGLEASCRVLERLEVFSLAESLGGVESLIEHPGIMTHASMPAERRAQLGIDDNLLRLSVGIESEADLIRDLEIALEHA